MRLPLMVVILLLCLFSSKVFSQDQTGLAEKITSFPSKFLDKLKKKANNIEEQVIKKTEKTLAKLEKQEKKLKRKLASKDSLAAANTFGDIEQKYQSLRLELKEPKNSVSSSIPYNANIDTITTSLNFLNQYKEKLSGQFNIPTDKVVAGLGTINSLKGKLEAAQFVRNQLRYRREQLREQLNKFGFIKEFQKYNRDLFYYSQQLKEYQNLLKDPVRLQSTAMSLLVKIPLFQQFMKQHSELAQIFALPQEYGSLASLNGLQTRDEIMGMINDRISSGGPNAGASIQQNIQQAQSELHSLKQKVQQMGANGTDDDVPDFKPNTQKTKTFWDRLEYGTNMQNSRANQFFPTTSDLGLSVGYKINDKSIVGFGASYKIGWGKDFKNISITQEGVGLRSFIDWKIKGGFYLSGGYEQNYRNRFNNLQALRENPNNWAQSGLLGLSKRYTIGKKLSGDVRLLFDFLYRKQIPQTQPFVFRMGYNFLNRR